jgi:Transcriptional regulatory protein, C terminal
MLDFPKNGKATVNNRNRIRFGSFEADLSSGEIRKSGSRIKLQDQPFKVLQILLEHAGDLVTREELQSRIWPEDSFGDFDHAVNVAVGKLRAALSDSAENPSFISFITQFATHRIVEARPPTQLGDGQKPANLPERIGIGVTGFFASGHIRERKVPQPG